MSRQKFRLGLIGYPLGHSLSPRLHQAALDALGLGGEYRLYPVPPLPAGTAELEFILQQLREGCLQGLNVTIPHKTSVLPYIQELTPPAAAVGAVNTIFVLDGMLSADNTDIPGFQRGLAALLAEDVEPGIGLVLGAGGSARAVAYALQQSGWQVNIAARRMDQAQQLLEGIQAAGSRSSRPNGTALELSLPGLRDFLAQISDQEPVLVVNSTPVGMAPHPEASPWPDGLPLPRRGYVYDLVYNPPETDLLRQAHQSGLSAANGLGMLVEQAALAFECWTGFPAPRQVMAQAVGIQIK